MKQASDLLNKVKNDPNELDKLIFKGKHIAEYDVKDLKIDVLASGFPGFDEKMVFKRGRGELILIGARPSQGKSSLLLQLAFNIARVGRSHVVSLEDSHESIVTRQTALLLNRPMSQIQHGVVSERMLLNVQEELKKTNLVIDDEGGLNVYQICERVRMQNKKQALAAVFIDYIQIIKSDRKNSRAEDLGTISGELKHLAKELKIPVICASQLNRNSDLRENKTPQLSDLKESGSLEQDADVVLLINRQNEDAEVIIAKNKNGPTDTVKMHYQGAQCKFTDKGVVIEEKDEKRSELD